MAAPSSASIIRVPGRLIANPTDLGTTEPFGGTYLGTCRNIRFRPKVKYRNIWGEAEGVNTDSFYVGEGPELTCILRYPDSDMISNTAPKSISSGSSGIHWLFRPGGTTSNTRAGTSMNGQAIKLLFSPKANTAHPMILIYNAIPQLLDDFEIAMSFKEEYAYAVRFLGAPDSSGRAYDTGQKANLVL